MEKYAPTKLEKAPRDIVSRAIMWEIEAGRGVTGKYGNAPYINLDLRHMADILEEKLPMITEIARKFNDIDAATEFIPIRPATHYTMGGISVGLNTETEVPGIFGAGENVAISIHGANRLGSNSTNECLAFGNVAGRMAAEWARSHDQPDLERSRAEAEEKRIWDELLNRNGGEDIARIAEDLRITMDSDVGVFRNGPDLVEAMKKIKSIEDRYRKITLVDKSSVFNLELTRALEVGFMIDLAEIIAKGALMRKESRGAHYRKDFPERDDANFLKHTIARYTKGGVQLEYTPVTITKWKPAPRVY